MGMSEQERVAILIKLQHAVRQGGVAFIDRTPVEAMDHLLQQAQEVVALRKELAKAEAACSKFGSTIKLMQDNHDASLAACREQLAASEQRADDAELDLAHWKGAEQVLSDSYVRLRSKIPGAFDTPTAPTTDAEQQETEVKASEDVAAELRIAADGIEFRWFNDPRANPPPAMIAHLRALADRLAPPARVRMCPRCDKHPAGESDLCDACRPGVMGTATAEPPFRQETGRTDFGGPQIDRPEPAATSNVDVWNRAGSARPPVPSELATAAEPLTAEDGLRERAEAVLDEWYNNTASGTYLHRPDWLALVDLLLAFARAAPTARAIVMPEPKPTRHLLINDTVPETYQTGRADGWNMALVEVARLNPPATAGGSKNKGAVS